MGGVVIDIATRVETVGTGVVEVTGGGRGVAVAEVRMGSSWASKAVTLVVKIFHQGDSSICLS